MAKKTTITDVPRTGASDGDKLGLSAYEKGLEQFLRGAETPITIALQGEWGSGKTSLMNVLQDNLCGEDGKSGEYFPVWINTWEFSLMRDSKEALKQILLKMSKEVVSFCSTTSQEVTRAIFNGIIGLGSAVAKTVANSYLNGAGDGIQEALLGNSENSIADLRDSLQHEINECIKKNAEKKGFIFFVDDLDRIDPPVAVELLELLKNIFTLKNCIFVLAIDYDVVIKGLKPKFGDLNENNEREFRSFFDKIIQVPFSMPVSQYSTKDYLIEELKKIEILSAQDETNKKLIQNIVKAETLTIGPNPRSMKRFLNTLSLIKCINAARHELSRSKQPEEDVKDANLSILLNIAIVGIQVAYPKVYQLLCIEPGFTKWDDAVAAKMNVPRIDKDASEQLKKFEEFDEEWEQVLYRLCKTDKYLQKNAINISQLFNMLRNEILAVATMNIENVDTEEDIRNAKDNVVREFIQDQMSQSSITGFSAGDAAPLEYDWGQLMRDVQWQLYLHAKSKFPNVEFSVPRVRYNGGIRTKGYSDIQIWQTSTHNGAKILFQFRAGTCLRLQSEFPQMLPTEIPNHYVQQNINEIDDMDKSLFLSFMKETKIVENNDCYNLWAERRILTNGKFCFALNFDVTFDSPESFMETNSLKTMKDVVVIFFDIIFKFANLK
ncbi:MAG: hypothetical protein HUK14_11760 [Muribaculaceae bacterium]|nr:hypothetical protein [Muribaculaceae bacterium]